MSDRSSERVEGMTENNCIQKSCERSALLIKIAELEAQLEDMQQHAKVSGDIIKVAVKAQIDAEFELGKYQKCLISAGSKQRTLGITCDEEHYHREDE